MFLGLDIGSQGTRTIVCDEYGKVQCCFSRDFKILNASERPDFFEQRPQDWWNAACSVIRKTVKAVGSKNINAMSLDATSGTILALDKNNEPLTNGIMYNDSRANYNIKEILPLAEAHQLEHGYIFNSSYGLPKMLWIKENLKQVWNSMSRFIHQADYIIGKLTGNFHISDYSNSLKSGCDLIYEKWPDFIENLGIPNSLLPELVPTGSKIGYICPEAALETGLSMNTIVYAGATDGFASSLAAGLAIPGDWASIIGTTLVVKGITSVLHRDVQGRIYSHKHPQGWWMPGGASNVGGRVLNDFFGEENFAKYNQSIHALMPTGLLYYPLMTRGERFPFVKPEAEGFFIGDADAPTRYVGTMEGIGYVERLSYDVLKSLGCELNNTILASGGACKSAGWLQMRANILGKCIKVPQETGAAMGSAIIAASNKFGRLSDAVRSLVKIQTEIEPDMQMHLRYTELYSKFKEICIRKGWVL